MDKLPHRDPHLREAIEACRPGSDDLHSPEMASLREQLAADPELQQFYDRVKHFDRRLAEAFRDVPVPEGLEARILARLGIAGAVSAADSRGDVAEAAPMRRSPFDQPPEAAQSRRSRRWLFRAAAAVAASLLVGTFVYLQRPIPLAESQILDAARSAFQSEGTNAWNEGAPPDRFLPSGYVRRVSLARVKWRELEGFLGHQAVVYDLTRPDGPSARLYVVRANAAGLPPLPPSAPQSTTHGMSVSAWAERGLLCILVVDGTPRDYQRYLQLPQGPVA